MSRPPCGAGLGATTAAEHTAAQTGAVLRLMQGLLPTAVEHAETSTDFWELFNNLLYAAGDSGGGKRGGGQRGGAEEEEGRRRAQA